MIGIGEVQGHWQRAWLRSPDSVDHDTCVHWMQCGSVYADVRIPRDRPDVRGARALDELSPACLANLMRSEGFAGEITIEDDVCTWARDINWHGAREGIDAGRLEFDDDGSLIEDGVHGSYRELWQRIDDLPNEGLELVSETGERAFLVTVGVRFIFGIGKTDIASSADLLATLACGQQDARVAAHFEGVHALGHWERDTAVADLATNPLIEGKPLLSRTRSGFVWHSIDFFGTARDVALSAEFLNGAAA